MTDRKNDQVDELDLQAFADGHLDRDPPRKAMVEAYLDANPSERDRLRGYRVVTEQIRNAYSDVLDEPIPQRFADILMSDTTTSDRKRLRARVVAALLVLGAAGAGWSLGHFVTGGGTPTPNIAQGIDMHRAAAESPPEGQAARRVGSLQSGATALNDTLVMAAPDLSTIGYTLDRTETKEGATQYRTSLFYRDREGDVITLVLERPKEPADTAPTVERLDDLQGAYWQDGALTVLVIGDRIEPNLPTIKSAVDQAFQKIEKASPPALPLGAPLMAEDRTSETAPGAEGRPPAGQDAQSTTVR
mgnify:CR=1 FL=1